MTHETPYSHEQYQATSSHEKIELISHHIAAIMTLFGLDLTNPSLCATPQRVATAYVNELFAGLNPHNFPAITLFDHKTSDIVSTTTSFASICEHHLLPFSGIAHVAYLPHQQVIGISKISRIVRHYAARPQIQERLSEQIKYSLMEILDHEDVAVCIHAQHSCVTQRGVHNEQAVMTTYALAGAFKTSLRQDFLTMSQQRTS